MSAGQQAETARIYLDVDGVFNAVNSGEPQWGWGAAERAKVNGFPITWSPELVTAINEATAQPGVETYWLTTWCHDAVDHLVPALGINGADWPVVGYDHWRADDHTVWWKLKAIQEHLAGFDGTVIWIDDDIRFDAATKAWLLGQPLIVPLSPRTELGVTKYQWSVARQFLDEMVIRPGTPTGGES